jgi:hypothetical protein
MLKKLYLLRPVNSEYLGGEYSCEDEERAEAVKLSRHILWVLQDTWAQAEAKGLKPGGNIAASISNYVNGGRLARRGGYGKLGLLADDYGAYLSGELSRLLGKSIRVTLVHDGTAAAAAFAEVRNSAVIALGTNIGVGFPRTDLDLTLMAEKLLFEKL